MLAAIKAMKVGQIGLFIAELKEDFSNIEEAEKLKK